MESIEVLVTDGIARVNAVTDLNELDIVKASYLGKSGAITEIMKGLSKLSGDISANIHCIGS